ncbi:hypothetical protein SAMN05216218_12613 [Halorientalis regularis]|uniref:Uncharacterized protein n=2 Tax=Halorientalis regularis TaxID=660518 RepID=A0A1G7TJQ5_9EURY|nr:hypothetical protein SAMN05216218_12613 [Halorientalis regularis]
MCHHLAIWWNYIYEEIQCTSMDRRQFLTSVGAVITMSTAGCSSESATDSPNPDSTDDTEGPETTTEAIETSTQARSSTPVSDTNILIDDTIELSEGENSHADFSVSSPATVEYDFTVQDNIEIDFFVLSLGNFQRYRSGQSFTAIQAVDGSEAADNISISRGNYYVVLDHSDRGPTSPPGQFEKVSATVDATISYTI